MTTPPTNEQQPQKEVVEETGRAGAYVTSVPRRKPAAKSIATGLTAVPLDALVAEIRRRMPKSVIVLVA